MPDSPPAPSPPRTWRRSPSMLTRSTCLVADVSRHPVSLIGVTDTEPDIVVS